MIHQKIKEFEIISDKKQCNKNTEKSCKECKYKLLSNLFKQKTMLYKLPINKKNVKTFLVSKTNTFKLTSNSSGNMVYMFNPFILWNTNFVNNSQGQTIRLEYFNNNPNFIWGNNSVNADFSYSTYLNAQSFINSTYIKAARLIKGYVNIKSIDSLSSTKGKCFCCIGNYALNILNGNYTTAIDDVKFGNMGIDNMKSKLHFFETYLSNGIQYIIPPDYWSKYSFYQFEPDNIIYPMGLNTAIFVLGVYSGKPQSVIDVEIELFYEVTPKEYAITTDNSVSNIEINSKQIKTLTDLDMDTALNSLNNTVFSNMGSNYKKLKLSNNIE